MRVVGIKVLKNKLSEYVRLAAGGEVILVADRDRVVAELIPPRQGRSEWVDDAALLDLFRRGLARPPLRKMSGPPPNSPILPFEQIMKDLEEDREDR